MKKEREIKHQPACGPVRSVALGILVSYQQRCPYLFDFNSTHNNTCGYTNKVCMVFYSMIIEKVKKFVKFLHVAESDYNLIAISKYRFSKSVQRRISANNNH